MAVPTCQPIVLTSEAMSVPLSDSGACPTM
jgi:hypothetical protein